ncbi:MAG: chromosomal replication initiator protein DnaA [Deltaproteobacteria bacterium]|nr:chromosomal replication initiator protein DnaA [Deltaproteobacteria bacterium]
MKGVWESVKTSLKEQMPDSGFHLWIEPLLAKPDEDRELTLICPNSFALRWIKSNYLPLIRQGLKSACGMSLPVNLTVAPGKPRLSPGTMTWQQPALPLLPDKSRSSFNRAFTFEQFVVGSSNRLAFQASQALARNDTFYNQMLFLTSGPGLGKSHLSQAVGHFLTQSLPASQVLYLSAENFANEMVAALKGSRMGQFKERFRQCEALLLEEVQFLSGKEKIQAEFCYTLDTLVGRGKRVVFTSCCLPGEIPHLSQELRSRLMGGVIIPIGAPDFSTRLNILHKKAENRGVQVSVKILEHLAEYLTEDVRRLESALDGLVARSTLLEEPVSLRLAQEVLQDLQAVKPGLTIAEIQKIVAAYYRMSLAELLGRSRQKRLVRARQMALYFSRLYTDKTLVELGRLFQRSHASVTHALQTLERDRKTQPRLAQEVELLEEKLAEAQVKAGWRRASTPRSDA